MNNRLWIVLCLVLIRYTANAQDTSAIANGQLISSFTGQVTAKVAHTEQKMDQYTSKVLRKIKKQEDRIKRKLERKDSIKAVAVFNNTEQQYKQLEQRLQKVTSLQQYVPSLDTLSSSLRFLQQNQKLLTNVADLDQKLNDALSKVEGLEQQFQKAEEIKNFLREKKLFLKEQLQNLGFAKELKKLNKRVYYYQAQIAEYKEILKDKKRVEKKVIELLSKTKPFRDFMSKNSFLARLFPIPANSGSMSLQSPQSGFAGLQTRLQVNSFIQQAGWTGQNAMSQMRQNMQDAQSVLTKLREQIARAGGNGGDDLEMPDFKINNQKTKSFFKRLEYGVNFQTQRSRNFFPATGDFGLSVGYKLNDKSIVGIGASYKAGFGSGWDSIKITHEGFGLRTYVDWKIKGGLWISGGYEQNYLSRFQSIDELKDQSAWQKSGLLGITRTFSLKSKFFKKTKVQLLWDFLSYQQTPVTQPVLFRIGYNF